MPYSICGLIIQQSEHNVCADHKWPFVALDAGVSLIPIDRDYLFLAEGDETAHVEHCAVTIPEWLVGMASKFTAAAYIEAEFFGGEGMQASCVWNEGKIVSEPLISSGAINVALYHMGVVSPSRILFGLPLNDGPDLFDVVGLGRHRSVAEWLKIQSESNASTNGGQPIRGV